MANPGYSCNPNTLAIASTCFLEPANGEATREGIEIYAKIANLKAIGGTDYSSSLATLMTAAGAWRLFQCNQRQAIATYRVVADAVADGASIATDINSLKKGAKCYRTLGKEDRKNLLAFLSCAIATLGRPE